MDRKNGRMQPIDAHNVLLKHKSCHRGLGTFMNAFKLRQMKRLAHVRHEHECRGPHNPLP
jgi:hypothetical protein